VVAPAYGPGIQVHITGASVDAATRAVVVSYTLSEDGAGMTGAVARRMLPAFTLAGLATEPVSGLPAWRSYVLSGKGRISRLPVAGPGTPDAAILRDTRQPGADVDGAVNELGQGRFTYRFTVRLPAESGPDETLRVGVWLRGAPGTRQTTSTWDFTSGGKPPSSRELVVDADCENCHGIRQGHSGSRTGTRICLTCHTYQHADPDTLDPAAMAGATLDTNPNPLEFGRLIHRIHRGRQLPTLFTSSSTAVAPPLPPAPGVTLPLPFLSGRNAALLGQKFSVIDDELGEQVFGAVVTRTANGRAPVTLTTGVWLPQDYRNCDVCHGGAAQRQEMITDTSRRTCQGCHPDVWYGEGTTDAVHFPHTGGPQPDDTRCATCHLRSVDNPTPMVPHEDAHVVPYRSPYYNSPVVRVMDVQNFLPGQKPTIVLSVVDRDGVLSPLNAPTPATDPQSPVKRAVSSISLLMAGPTSDYVSAQATGATTSGTVSASVPGATVADASDLITYTLPNALPANISGTWAIGLQASRSSATTIYDATAGVFRWPYTGESLRETIDNVVVYVDTADGTLHGGNPVRRRMPVDVSRCEKCHIRLAQHGGGRNKVELCIMCHAPAASDWNNRTKDSLKNVDLAATADNLEERSIHFKVMMHRMHTGNHVGRAELERNVPLTWATGRRFYDDVGFPNKIKNCRLCHAGNSFYVENVPAGAAPTVANETSTLMHLATAPHVPGELSVPPLKSACNACHDTLLSAAHCNQYTTDGIESCAPCHAEGMSLSVSSVHGLEP
jgi:OmcA/MtrC family decaheme c-type cytochrome